MGTGRHEPPSVTGRLLAARRHRERAYAERNELVVVLTKLWPSHLMPVTGSLQTLDEKVAVCIHSPAGHLVWVITEAEAAAQFAHLTSLKTSHWKASDDAATRSIRLAKLTFEKPKRSARGTALRLVRKVK